MNPFIWIMAWREIRGSLRRFIFFLFCIALGVSSLVGVNNVSLNLDQTIKREARNLLAADLEIRNNQPLSNHQIQEIEALGIDGLKWVRITELNAMAAHSATGKSQLVELKAVDPGYPFYGTLEVNPPPDVPFGSSNNNGKLQAEELLVQKALLSRLGLRVGESLKIGQGSFTIKGIIIKEPDRIAGSFSFGPRIIISQEGLALTELVQPGSRIRYRTLIKISASENLSQVKNQLELLLSSVSPKIRTYLETQPSITRFLKQLGIYLGMVGLATLMIGGIGVANGVRVFLKQRMDSIAILKCLGANSKLILQIYFFQVICLGVVGSLLGVIAGLGLSEFLESVLGKVMGIKLGFHPLPGPVLRGFGLGLLTTLLFTLWPLLSTKKISPFRLFRRDIENIKKDAPGWTYWCFVFLFICGLGLLAIWQVGSVKLGVLFIVIFVVAFIVLRSGSWLLIKSLKTFPPLKSLPFRLGLSNLCRPGNQTHTLIFSIGLGITIIFAIHFVQYSLIDQIRLNLPSDTPSLFFIDIQPDQKPRIKEIFSQEESLSFSNITPIIRTRIHSVKAKVVGESTENSSKNWYFTREYVVTIQSELPRHNIIEKGTWWNQTDYEGGALISVEKEAAKGLGVDIGSQVVFDIQGVQIPAKVNSIRKVDWGSMTSNFYIIFSPGGLDGVPLNYIATARLPQEKEPGLQDAIVHQFPNITTINLRDILDTVSGMLNQISLVIRFMAGFGIIAGLIVLSSTISATRLQRIRETAILKSLGATRSMILQAFAVEYALVGLSAGIVGTGLSTLMAWIAVKYIFELSWIFSWWGLITGMFLAVTLTVMTGFFSSYRILGEKPLPLLNAE